ncbi:hypothetical protein BCR34DRAFT_335865 [Clohesyomyces aquaticus]|uniref:Uncharacterized protein n=1 Tax=Clohesyomyces aquaticus TaxID=1231657 RepID=A0A1Y1XUH8_9PLEO|nr:hypothetical protein BCR34DRAFT_335865 [Clohesyomyces aquaticus]
MSTYSLSLNHRCFAYSHGRSSSQGCTSGRLKRLHLTLVATSVPWKTAPRRPSLPHFHWGGLIDDVWNLRGALHPIQSLKMHSGDNATQTGAVRRTPPPMIPTRVSQGFRCRLYGSRVRQPLLISAPVFPHRLIVRSALSFQNPCRTIGSIRWNIEAMALRKHGLALVGYYVPVDTNQVPSHVFVLATAYLKLIGRR